MQQLSLEEGELKAGLKIVLGTLVKQCSSILIDHFATSGQKAVADEIREFREVFVAPIHYAKVMARQAMQCIVQSSVLARNEEFSKIAVINFFFYSSQK